MKKVFTFITCLFAFCILGIQAQEKKTIDQMVAYEAPKDSVDGWRFKGLVGINFGQSSLTNWSAGGENTVSLNAILNVGANYTKGIWFWDNFLGAEYGMINSSSEKWKKSVDRLNITSIAGRQISRYWSVAFLLNFNTQFTKGYNYPHRDHYISTFMAPGYLDGALGFTYRPNSHYSVFLSPLAERATFVLNDSLSNIGAFGVDPGKKVKWQTGAYLLASANQTITQNLSLISTLDMFTPYNDDFGNVDINWNILLNYKFAKLFSASLSTTLRYYDREIQKIQLKEIFGLGVTYTF